MHDNGCVRQARGRLDEILLAVEAYSDTVFASITALLQSDGDEARFRQIEELVLIESALEPLTAPPSLASTSASAPPKACSRAAALLQKLKEIISENSEAQKIRVRFREALRAYDKAVVEQLLEESGALGDDSTQRSLRTCFIRDVRSLVRTVSDETSAIFNERPVKLSFDGDFVKRWDFFHKVAGSPSVTKLLAEARQQIGEQSDPERNEFSDALEALLEALVKVEMEGKSMVLNYLAHGLQSRAGGVRLRSHFREPADALSFLLDLVGLASKAGEVGSPPFTGDRIGGSCSDVVDAVHAEYQDKMGSLEKLLSTEPVHTDFDLESVGGLLEGLQLRAALYTQAKRAVESGQSIPLDFSSHKDCSLERVFARVESFLKSNFGSQPRLTDCVPASSLEKNYLLLAKQVRASLRLRYLKNFLTQTEAGKALFRNFCGDDSDGGESIFCKTVEGAVNLLLVEIDSSIGKLPSVEFSDQNKVPAVASMETDIIPKLRRIDSLGHNLKYFKLLVSPHFPWALNSLGAHDSIGALQNRFLRIVRHFEGLPAEKSDEISSTLVYLHVHTSELVLLTGETKPLIETALAKFKEKFEGQAVLKLGVKLREEQFLPFGERVVQSYDAFKANVLDVFNKKTSGQDIKYVLEQLGCGGEARIPTAGLLSAYEALNSHYDKIIQKAISSKFSASFTTSVVEDIKKLAADLRSKCTSSNIEWPAAVARRLHELLAQILALWTLQNSERFLKSLDAGSKASYLFRPHPVQIAAMLCLLGLGPPKANLEGPVERSLVQVKTGEGKTVVLGVTACFFALMGIEVSCACYSEYLSKRDKDSMDPLFRALDVDSAINYCTLVKLCEDEINKKCNIRANVQATILGKAAQGVTTSTELRKGRRVLLVDEVDVFFSEDFYGMPYSPACDLQHESIENLLRCIWSKQSENPSFSDVILWPEYAKAKAIFSGWEFLLESAVTHILVDLKTFAGHKYEVVGGKIGYKEQDSIVFNVRYGYKTMFAYLKEESSGRISGNETSKNLKILVNCGTFLFAKFPNKFDLVSGVTGTLETLTEGEKTIISKDYKITKFYYMPSAYGKNDRFVDRGIMLTSSENHSLEILKDVEANIKGRAVIIFFDSYEQLDSFSKSQEFKDCMQGAGVDLNDVNILVEQTPGPNKQQIVSSRSTSKNAVTLATKPFGRGTDFISMDPAVNQAGGIHVIQTFLSESMSEEIQIKGRTARQGDPGTYSMILTFDNVREMLGLDKESMDTIEAAWSAQNMQQIQQILKDKREQQFSGKFDKLKKFVADHDSVDVEAWAFVNNLVSKAKAGVVDQITKWNSPARTARILILVDATGSMQGLMDRLKNNLTVMFQRAKEILDTAITDTSAQFEMQIAVYRNYGSGKVILLEHSEWVSNPQILVDYLQGVRAKGGEGNEAIEIGLGHASKQRDLKQVVLIGDARANTDAEVTAKRGGQNRNAGANYDPKVCDEYWKGTEYEIPTNYEKEARKLAGLKPPVVVDAYYLVNKPEIKKNFEEIATLTQGNHDFLDVSSKKGEDLLIAHISRAILKQVRSCWCCSKVYVYLTCVVSHCTGRLWSVGANWPLVSISDHVCWFAGWRRGPGKRACGALQQEVPLTPRSPPP